MKFANNVNGLRRFVRLDNWRKLYPRYGSWSGFKATIFAQLKSKRIEWFAVLSRKWMKCAKKELFPPFLKDHPASLARHPNILLAAPGLRPIDSGCLHGVDRWG